MFHRHDPEETCSPDAFESLLNGQLEKIDMQAADGDEDDRELLRRIIGDEDEDDDEEEEGQGREDEIISEPHENDVLMGRGGKNNQHSGNEKLREIARAHCEQYKESSKKGKSYISRQLVKIMRELEPPARYVILRQIVMGYGAAIALAVRKEVTQTNTPFSLFIRFLKRNNQTGTWEDVGDETAREKASQVLRDAVALLEQAEGTEGESPGSRMDESPEDIKMAPSIERSRYRTPKVSSGYPLEYLPKQKSRTDDIARRPPFDLDTAVAAMEVPATPIRSSHSRMEAQASQTHPMSFIATPVQLSTSSTSSSSPITKRPRYAGPLSPSRRSRSLHEHSYQPFRRPQPHPHQQQQYQPQLQERQQPPSFPPSPIRRHSDGSNRMVFPAALGRRSSNATVGTNASNQSSGLLGDIDSGFNEFDLFQGELLETDSSEEREEM